MLIDIPIDFSALSNLYCIRKYQLNCVRGIDSSSAETNFGNAAHGFFEARNKGDTTPAGVIIPALAAKYNVADPAAITKLMLVAVGFDQQKHPAPLVDTANKPMAEYKFSWPWAVVGRYRIVLCGTMDLLFCQDMRFLVIRDYKTTAAVGAPAANIVAGYTSSTQLDFYAYALHKFLYQFLPAPFDEMALALKITGQYLMVYKSLASPRFEPTPFCQITAYSIDQIEQLLALLVPRAIAAHEMSRLAPAEGAAYKLCPKCSYHTQFCIRRTEDEILAEVNKYPIRQYDPTNFR